MTQSRLTLHYDAALGRENTWRLCEDARSIAARVRVASAAEYHVTIELRRSMAAPGAPDRSFLRRLDGESWLVSSGNFHEALPRLELGLVAAPEVIGEILADIP